MLQSFHRRTYACDERVSIYVYTSQVVLVRSPPPPQCTISSSLTDLFSNPMHSRNVFTPFAGIAIVLLLAVIPWHIKAKNLAVILLSIWIGADVLCLFINSILWWDNADIKAKIWCDISTKVIYAGLIAPACCCLCVLRRLEAIASTRVVQTTPQMRRKQLWFDLIVGAGIPVTYTGLHIVNQGHRFDIVEGIGCLPTTYWTAVAVALYLLPPLIVSLITVIYGLMALRWLVIRNDQFNAVLRSSCSHVDRSRYFRLMAMACTEALFSFPVNIATFAIKFVYQQGLNPWISWDDTHYGFDFIGQVRAADFEEASANSRRYWATLELGRWGIVVGCFLIFAFFGTSGEASQIYRRLSQACAARVKRKDHRTRSGVELPTGAVVAVQTAWNVDEELKTDEYDLSREDLGSKIGQ
ncbi:hypothetical protein V8E36_009370 [Tilletia maclaganii]